MNFNCKNQSFLTEKNVFNFQFANDSDGKKPIQVENKYIEK